MAPLTNRTRRVGRALLVGAAVIALATAPVAAASAHPSAPAGGAGGAPAGPEPPGGWVTTAAGPLGPADRDLLVKVRQAGLWEMPAGEQAQRQAASRRVREVGRMIADQHATLDAQVLTTAARLGVALPDRPSAEQQAWLDQLARLRGAEFDRAYAQLLRAAHGKVFSVIAAVRAGTRNEIVRAFADTANQAVLTHMKLLESTGLVDHEALPPPPDPPATLPLGLPAGPPGVDPAVLWLVLIAAGLTGAATTVRAIRQR